LPIESNTLHIDNFWELPILVFIDANDLAKRKKEMAKQALKLGNNVDAVLEGNILTLTIDLSKRSGRSASGKNVVIASTNGNQSLPNGEKIGVNCYTKD